MNDRTTFKTFFKKKNSRLYNLPRKHCPSSSSSLSITKGGDKAVTTLKTVLARVETAATERSPPGHMIVSNRTDLPETIPTLFHLELVGGYEYSEKKKLET